MSSSATNDIRATVDEVCAQIGLDEFAANTVERWVRTHPNDWPDCCLGGCDPCNDVIRAAARAVLEKLETQPS